MRKVDWQSSTGGLSQIWLQIREKSSLFLKSNYQLMSCKNLQSEYGYFNLFLLKMWQIWKIFSHKILSKSCRLSFLVFKWQKYDPLLQPPKRKNTVHLSNAKK